MRLYEPTPRVQLGQALRGMATSAIDISDGLLADANHLAVASRVTLSLDVDRVPCVHDVSPVQAAVSGEEYELLLAMPAVAGGLAGEFEEQFGVSLTEIGVVEPASDAPVKTRGGRVDPARGHDHFS